MFFPLAIQSWCVRWYRVGLKRLPAQAPLRTVRESFPSHGSSLSKINLCRGDPAIRFRCNSILSCQLIRSGCERTGLSDRISAPGEASPLLKILDRLRLVRIGFSSNLDVALDHGPRHRIRAEDTPLSFAVMSPDREGPPLVCGMVPSLDPAAGFIGMVPTRPAPEHPPQVKAHAVERSLGATCR